VHVNLHGTFSWPLIVFVLPRKILQLEKKFRNALAFKEQTGQVIIKEAKEPQKEAGNAGNDSGAENAKNKTEGTHSFTCLQVEFSG
jgi:hypothetical protein